MTLRQLIWHPACLLIALLCTVWELCFTPDRATLADFVCGAVCVAWFASALSVRHHDGAL